MSQATLKKPRKLHVVQSIQLTPHLQRITFGGEELNDFPAGSHGAHLKLLLPQQGQPLVLPIAGPHGLIWPTTQERPVVRTYTVRRFDTALKELAVDFVLHDAYGPASDWARHAKAGDEIGLVGPAGPALFNPEADFFLLAGDLSALPLISAVLETLPGRATGHAFIEIPALSDQQPLQHPPGMQITWLSNAMHDAVLAMPWPAGSVSATVAGEADAVIRIRKYLRLDKKLSPADCYAVPYWKKQHSEEAYHDERHRVLDEVLSGT
jgi:NADPH-dependent ferric siderophore reductase